MAIDTFDEHDLRGQPACLAPPLGPCTVSVINGSDNTSLARPSSFPGGSNPQGIAVNQVTNMIYVTDLGTGTVTPINGATNTAGAPVSVGFGTNGIAVDAATNVLYVADSAQPAYAVDGTTFAITQISGALTSPGPYGVDLDPATGEVYVTNASANYVTVYHGLPGLPAAAPTETCNPSALFNGETTTCTITLSSVVPIGGTVTRRLHRRSAPV